jgi:hypothetical protein
MALGDQVGKQAADELVAQFPGIEAFVDAQLAKLQTTLEQVVGDTLADLTAERTQAISQLGDVLHGVLDRLNGATLTLSVGATSVTLKVPPKAT